MNKTISAAAAAAAVAATAWAGDAVFPTWHGATSLSGVAADPVPDTPVQLWKFRAGAPVSFTPVMGDGKVFFANAKSRIFALDMKGHELWSKPLELKPVDTNTPPEKIWISAPPAYAFGTLVLVSPEGGVYALNGKDGSEKWTATVGDTIKGTPNFVDLGSNGWLVVVMTEPKDTGVVTAFDGATGAEKWHTEPYGQADGHIAVSGKRIAFGACDATIHVLSGVTGNSLLDVPLGEGGEVAGGVAVVGRMVYTGSRGGALHAVDMVKKEIKWSFGGGSGELFTTPAANSNVVVFSTGSGAVIALDVSDPTKEKWSFDAGGMKAESPIIAGDRVVVTVDGKIHILDLNDGKKPIWTSASLGDGLTAPAVAAGMIVVGSDAGSVVAFGAKPGSADETK